MSGLRSKRKVVQTSSKLTSCWFATKMLDSRSEKSSLTPKVFFSGQPDFQEKVRRRIHRFAGVWNHVSMLTFYRVKCQCPCNASPKRAVDRTRRSENYIEMLGTIVSHFASPRKILGEIFFEHWGWHKTSRNAKKSESGKILLEVKKNFGHGQTTGRHHRVTSCEQQGATKKNAPEGARFCLVKTCSTAPLVEH